MRHMKLMKRILLSVLFVFLMSLFTSTFVSALQESDDNSDESTTVLSRQRRGRCPNIRGQLSNGWVRTRNRNRIAKFVCNNGYELVGSRIITCLQGKWNNPIPVCAKRGCNQLVKESTYSVQELLRGTVMEVRCQTGFTFSGPFLSYRVYCNGSNWLTLGSVEDLSNTDQYLCKSTESHFKTSEEISTISPLNSAVTAKSETTTKFNSKMPEMTAMFVSSVININATSTESTSLFADNSKTPITEPIDKSYTSTNTTNIIQEVSTLTTTVRFNRLQTPMSLNETTPNMDFTTLPKQNSFNYNNYSINSEKPFLNDSNDSKQNLNASLTTPLTTPLTIPLSTLTIQQSSTFSPTVISVKNSTNPSNHSNLSNSPNITSEVVLKSTFLKQISISTSLVTPLSSETSDQTLMTSTIKTKKPTANTTQVKVTQKKEMQTSEAITSSTSTDRVVENSSKVTEIKTNETFLSSTTLSTNTLFRKSSTVQKVSMISTNVWKTTPSSTLNKMSETIPLEKRVTTALKPTKKSFNKMTISSNETHNSIATTRQSLSSSSLNSKKYSLFVENTTITPMRRRRQFTTKTRVVITSITSKSKEDNKRSLTTTLIAVISMTILVTILLSLYLIKKRKNSQQNRLSDDSEMRYLSSNEVF